jgi:hypothetical protein
MPSSAGPDDGVVFHADVVHRSLVGKHHDGAMQGRSAVVAQLIVAHEQVANCMGLSEGF